RKLGRLAQAGGRADGPELAFDAGDQQEQPVALAGSLDRGLLVVTLDGERDRHVGEDDDVVHGEDWEQLGLWCCHLYERTFTPDREFPILHLPARRAISRRSAAKPPGGEA